MLGVIVWAFLVLVIAFSLMPWEMVLFVIIASFLSAFILPGGHRRRCK